MRAADTAGCLQDVFIAVLRSLLQTGRSAGDVVLPEAASPDSSRGSSQGEPPAETQKPPQQKFQEHPLEFQRVGKSLGKAPCPPALQVCKCQTSELASAPAGILIKMVGRRRI